VADHHILFYTIFNLAERITAQRTAFCRDTDAVFLFGFKLCLDRADALVAQVL